MSEAKIKIIDGKIILPLHYSQGGIRIADKNGNHVSSPTKTIFKEDYYIEWMITNNEIKLLSSFFENEEINKLIDDLKKVNYFAEDTEYSKRTTSSDEIEIGRFEDFIIYRYTDIFNSFEKILESGIKVRLTFKLGDYGVQSHPHMYVLIPFNIDLLYLKNKIGFIKLNEQLGSGCFGDFSINKKDLKSIILTLACASRKHRDDLIKIIL
jgi:hypothetical protein